MNYSSEQWASEFLTLYPGANILAATQKDFQPANRKAFCARIATGGYDAVIIGHSQFEKPPLSLERQRAQIQDFVRVPLGSETPDSNILHACAIAHLKQFTDGFYAGISL